MKMTDYEIKVMNMKQIELDAAVREKCNSSEKFSCYFRKTPWKVKDICFYSRTIEMEETNKFDPRTETIDFKYFLTNYSKW